MNCREDGRDGGVSRGGNTQHLARLALSNQPSLHKTYPLLMKYPNKKAREVDSVWCSGGALIILSAPGVKYRSRYLRTSKSRSVDGVSVLLATGHIAIDWRNDRTISYLMLEMHQRQRHAERAGEKKESEREFD